MNAIVGLISTIFWLVIVLGAFLALLAVWGYNTLRHAVENVKEAQSNIDISLRKKVSLVNQLGDVAAKYMDRESTVMLKVSQDVATAATPQLYQQTGTVLSTIQGIAQKFPDLKANEQYTKLATAIAESEADVQNRRLKCNAAIKDYNTKRASLPHALWAGFLGFRPARYLELDTVESADASVQKQILSDDGDRLNELLGVAGARVIDATKTLASQGKLIAEKAASRVQTEIAARSAVAQYHYLDVEKAPKGPISRDQLDALFATGAITADTDVLEAGAKAWTKYASLPPQAPDRDPTAQDAPLS